MANLNPELAQKVNTMISNKKTMEKKFNTNPPKKELPGPVIQ